MVSIATSIDSVTTLNDGTEIPLFGLGTAWTENAESAGSYKSNYHTITTMTAPKMIK
jgi:hypothetical protein